MKYFTEIARKVEECKTRGNRRRWRNRSRNKRRKKGKRRIEARRKACQFVGRSYVSATT